MKACMGGWCRIRESCPHFDAADKREPAERLCEPGQDGEAVMIRRFRKEWERPAQRRPAGVFDGLIA